MRRLTGTSLSTGDLSRDGSGGGGGVFAGIKRKSDLSFYRRNDRYFVRRIYYGKADGKDTA